MSQRIPDATLRSQFGCFRGVFLRSLSHLSNDFLETRFGKHSSRAQQSGQPSLDVSCDFDKLWRGATPFVAWRVHSWICHQRVRQFLPVQHCSAPILEQQSPLSAQVGRRVSMNELREAATPSPGIIHAQRFVRWNRKTCRSHTLRAFSAPRAAISSSVLHRAWPSF